MAAEGKKGEPKKRISDKERFNFIGFDVFPGEPKDLFKSDAEKSKHVDAVKAKRDTGEVIRDECKLLEERVSLFDRSVLTIACVVIIGALFVPWFSAYNVVVEEVHNEPIAAVVDSTIVDDSTSIAMSDSTSAMAQAEDSLALAAVTDESVSSEPEKKVQRNASGDEVLHGYVAKKKIHKEYDTMNGFSVLMSIGSVGGYVFSSGFILMVTGVLIILFVLACLAIPGYTLYGLYGMKGDPDKQALALKKVLRLNWVPVLLLGVAFIISFVGADYGFDNESVAHFSSFGDAYGPSVFMGSLSYGVAVSLGAFVLNALKGIEI